MNQKLAFVANRGAEMLKHLIREGHEEIEETMRAVAEEAQAQDTAPKMRLAFTITIDVDKDSAVFDLTFGVRRKLSCAAKIEDPNQVEMETDARA